MDVKRMFREGVGERYSPEAEGFDHAIHDAVNPLFEAWAKAGYSTRDLGALCHWTIFDIEVSTRLNMEYDEVQRITNAT